MTASKNWHDLISYKMGLIKYLVLFFFFIIEIQFIVGQPIYFNNNYPFDNASSRFDGLSIGDSNFICSGVKINPLTYHQDLILASIDSLGNLNYWLNYGENNYDYFGGMFGSLIKTYDNCFTLAGSKYNYQLDISLAFLMKFHESFDIFWVKFYGDTIEGSYMAGTQCKQTIDNGFIIVGEEWTGNEVDILLLKTDSSGNKIWKKNFDIGDYDRGFSIVQTYDSGYFIGGHTFTPNNLVTRDPIIIKTDLYGNVEWIRNLGDEYMDFAAFVNNSIDSNLIVAACIGTEQYTPEMSKRQIHILKLNYYGDTIWYKKFNESRISNIIGNLVVSSDQNYIICGSWHRETGYGYIGWIFKINDNGDSLWMREYFNYCNQYDVNRLFDVINTSDGGYLSCGHTINYSNPPYNERAWLLKVDSVGCDTANCVYVYNHELNIKSANFVIYPNPAQSFINLNLDKWKDENNKCFVLIDLLGNKVIVNFIQDYETQVKVNVSNLKPGLYIGIIYSYNRQLERQKLIIVR